MPWVTVVRNWARRKNATPPEVALAWVMAQKPSIVPIPGTTKIAHMEENLGAEAVHLSADEIREFNTTVARLKADGARIEPFGEDQIDH
jgi:aryl-alcohol dehydrogenase-like predicted oxidoreductase